MGNLLTSTKPHQPVAGQVLPEDPEEELAGMEGLPEGAEVATATATSRAGINPRRATSGAQTRGTNPAATEEVAQVQPTSTSGECVDLWTTPSENSPQPVQYFVPGTSDVATTQVRRNLMSAFADNGDAQPQPTTVTASGWMMSLAELRPGLNTEQPVVVASPPAVLLLLQKRSGKGGN